MTIRDAINRLDALIFNTYTTDDKILWLSRLDAAVKEQIIDTHEGGELVPYIGYTPLTPDTTVLLVPEPYSDVYLRWMEAQIHYHNGENDRYNSAIILYNTAFENYAGYYNRTHMPRAKRNRFIF